MDAESIWTSAGKVHPDLLLAKQLLYDCCGLHCTAPIAEAESADYGAYDFNLNAFNVKFRVAKVTPKKIGVFVTFWKRVANGPIQPFDISDDIDLYIVSVRNQDRFGQFIFPKSTLFDKGLLSGKGREGKRAMRLYTPWDQASSAQALKTQKWQSAYFQEIFADMEYDSKKIGSLFGSLSSAKQS